MIEIIDFKQNKKDKIKVLVSQMIWDISDWSLNTKPYFITNKEKIKNYIINIFKNALESECNLIIFPELSIIKEYHNLIQEWSTKHNIIVVAGSYYKNKDDAILNVAPIFIDNKIYESEKLNPSPHEISIMNGKDISNGKNQYVFKNTNCGTIGVLICADYLRNDIKNSMLNHDIDILVVIAFHTPSNTYHALMNQDIPDSNDGIYIIYSNNYLDNNGDGKSSIFAMVDNVFKKGHKFNYPNQIYEITTEKFFIAELDLTQKKPPLAKNVTSRPNVKITCSDSKTKQIPVKANPKETSNKREKCKNIYEDKTYYKYCLKASKSIRKKCKNNELMGDFLSKLHTGFEHQLIASEERINELNNSLTETTLRQELDKILLEIKSILDLFSSDVSVHIKLLYQDRNKNYLKTIVHAPSIREIDLHTSHRLPKRSRDEYRITEELDIKKIKKKCQEDDIKINSAYNESIHGDYNYFICNNLDFASANQYFFNSCENYRDFYNSLLVIPIYDKIEGLEIDSLKGMLVMDSYKKGAFHRKYMEHLCAAFTHRINRLLSISYCKNIFFT